MAITSKSQKLSYFSWIIAPLITSIIAFLLYIPTLYYPFVFDDGPNILKCYNIRNKSFWDLFFSSSRWISSWLNTLYYKIARFDPFIYRLGNVTFHVITGFIIFYLILLMLKLIKKHNFYTEHAHYIALVTSALFLLHPVQTQTVSYIIQGQLEGLACLFLASMCLCFVLIAHSTSTFTKIFLTCLLYVLAVISCGTKEIAIISPVLLLLIDWFFVAQGAYASLRSRLWLHLLLTLFVFSIYCYLLKPHFFLDIISLKKTSHSNWGNLLTRDYQTSITPFMYFISQFQVMVHYIIIFIWPFNLSVDYEWKILSSFFSPACLYAFFILLILALIVYKRLKHNSVDLIAFGLLWFFITLIPRSSFIPASELGADYKTYLGSFGLFFLCSVILVKLISDIKNFLLTNRTPVSYPVLTYSCVLVISLSLAALTYSRNKVWSDPELFWHDVIAKTPTKARSYNNLGTELAKNKKYKQAQAAFKKALELDSNYADAWLNYSWSCSVDNNLDEAISAIRTSINLAPHCPEAHLNLAGYLIKKRELLEAQQELKQAIKLRSTYGKAWFYLGVINKELGNLHQAHEYFKACCTQADYDNPEGFRAWGYSAMNLSRYDEALIAFNKILEITPNCSATLQDIQECLSELQKNSHSTL